MRQEPLIKLEKVWKIYQLGELELAVLRGISLEIYPGAFMTIMGPSGSGKSTLMHLIGCLDIPTKGGIFLEGKDISGLLQDDLAQIRGQKIGFVFQQFNLLPNFTALENIMLPMIFQGILEKERQRRAVSLLKLVKMGDRFCHKPSELSGGEQQRVAVARSLANNPEIIVADEPTGNLDSITGKMIMEILVNLHQKEKKTIIVVTHDPNIASYSKNIINIKDGQIVSNHKIAKEVLWRK